MNSELEFEKKCLLAYKKLCVKPQDLSLLCTTPTARKSTIKIILKKHMNKHIRAQLKATSRLAYYGNSFTNNVRKLTFYAKDKNPVPDSDLQPPLVLKGIKKMLLNCKAIQSLDLYKLDDTPVFPFTILPRIKNLKQLVLVLMQHHILIKPLFFKRLLSLEKLCLQINSIPHMYLDPVELQISFQKFCESLIQHSNLERFEFDFKGNLHIEDQKLLPNVLFGYLNHSTKLTFLICIHTQENIQIKMDTCQNFLSRIEYFAIEQLGSSDQTQSLENKNCLIFKRHGAFDLNISEFLPFCTSLQNLSLIANDYGDILGKVKLPETLKSLKITIMMNFCKQAFDYSKSLVKALSTVCSLESLSIAVYKNWDTKIYERLAILHQMPIIQNLKSYSIQIFSCIISSSVQNTIFSDLSNFVTNMKELEKLDLMLYQRVGDFNCSDLWNTISMLKLKQLSVTIAFSLNEVYSSPFYKRLSNLKTLEALNITIQDYNQRKILEWLPFLPKLKNLKIQKYTREHCNEIIGMKEYIANKKER